MNETYFVFYAKLYFTQCFPAIGVYFFQNSFQLILCWAGFAGDKMEVRYIRLEF